MNFLDAFDFLKVQSLRNELKTKKRICQFQLGEHVNMGQKWSIEILQEIAIWPEILYNQKSDIFSFVYLKISQTLFLDKTNTTK